MDIVGLIPDVRDLENKKIITALYDRVKEFASNTKSNTDLNILITNFATYPTISSDQNHDLEVFLLTQFIAINNSRNVLLMKKTDIERCDDEGLSQVYREKLVSLEPIL